MELTLIMLMVGGLILVAGRLEGTSAMTMSNANEETVQMSRADQNKANNDNNNNNIQNQLLTVLQLGVDRRPKSAQIKEAASGDNQQKRQQLENAMRLAMLTAATKGDADRKGRLQLDSVQQRKQSEQQQQIDISLNGFEPQTRIGQRPGANPADSPDHQQKPIETGAKRDYNQVSLSDDRPRTSPGGRGSFQSEFRLADSDLADSFQQQANQLESGGASRGAHIRVVFNNNPHFIIGSSAGEPGAEASSRLPLQRKTRQPSATLFDDQYNLDESAPAETKVSVQPCNKERHEPATKLEPPAVQENNKVNLLDQDDALQDDSPVATPVAPQQVSKSKPPPIGVKQQQQEPPQQQQVSVQQSIEHSHSSKFEQMVKSGLRPPLRMVISMENNQGEFLKVPINLPGSIPGKGFDVGPPQVQVDAPAGGETAAQRPALDEENTPKGGDIFQPQLPAKLGGSKTKQTRDQPKSIVQQVAISQQVPLEPAPPVFKSTKEDCQQQQQQQHEIAPPAEPKTKVVEQIPTKGVVVAQQPAVEANPQPDLGQKTIQMTVPQFHELHDKTFTQMMSQFQKALKDQMSKHLKGGSPLDKSNPGDYQEQAGKRPEVQQQIQPDVQQQQQQAEDQDDLVVALMAANMRNSAGGGAEDAGSQIFRGPNRQQVSMTVIRPPKGTSIQEAVMQHAKEGQTMAIISSRLPSLESQAAMTRPAAEANGAEAPSQPPVSPPPPPAGANDQSGPGVDPDGFSSSSSDSLEGPPGQPYDSLIESIARMQFPFEWAQHQTRARFKRDTARGTGKVVAKKTTGKSVKKQAKSRRRPTDKNKADRRQRQQQMADHMQGAASQTESTSLASDNLDDDEDVDEDETSDGAGGGSGSASDGGNGDEPAPSASGEVGQSASGSAPPDDGDYNGDMGDDFDDSTAFDADDEPYNTAAASDRDYSGTFKSFEIPSIDINPDTLKQRGCRTVLREVQEIPLNGLGVVQANGQPGSGYQAGDASAQIEGLRVKRHVAASAGGQQQQRPNKNLINSRKVTSIVMTKECHFPNEEGAAAVPIRRKPIRVNERRPAGEQVAFFGNQGGGSLPRPSVVPPAQMRPSPVVNKVGLYQRQQQQQRVTPAKVVTNFYSNSRQQPIPQAAASQLVKYQLTQPADETRQPPPQPPQQQQPQQQTQKQQQDQIKASSSITRRSVAGAPPNGLAPSWWNAGEQTAMGSVANGVVAKKLYKPPSESDPFHTLSYSSQNGADPDMDQDEDDSVVMGAEAESRRDASAQKQPRGTMSERERAALMDPNHDDTDPVQRNAASNHLEGPLLDGTEPSDEVDESDSDLSDESRPNERRQRPRQGAPPGSHPARRPPAIKRDRVQALAKEINDHDEDEIERADDQTRYRPPLRPPPTHRTPAAPTGATNQRRGGPPERAFGRSFKFEHELSRPEARRDGSQPMRAVSGHLRQLSPGLKGYVNTNGRGEPVEDDGGHLGNQLKELAATPTLSRRQDMDMDDDDDDDDDDGGGGGGETGGRRRPAASVRSEDSKSAPDDSPDADPELNPREIHLPAHSKPKKFEKSFAYVHRDLPKKGAKNPDDFVVSYGRGNMQTEHEDYDSDRDHNSGPPPSEADEQDRAASIPRRTKLPDGRLLMLTSRLAKRHFGMRNTNSTMMKS